MSAKSKNSAAKKPRRANGSGGRIRKTTNGKELLDHIRRIVARNGGFEEILPKRFKARDRTSR